MRVRSRGDRKGRGGGGRRAKQVRYSESSSVQFMNASSPSKNIILTPSSKYEKGDEMK